MTSSDRPLPYRAPGDPVPGDQPAYPYYPVVGTGFSPQYGSAYPPPAYPAPGFGSYPSPRPAPRPQARRGLVGFGAAVVLAALAVGGVVLADTGNNSITGTGSTALQAPQPAIVTPGGGSGGSSSTPPITPTTPSTGGSTTTPSGSNVASATKQVGIVTIVSTLQYQQAQSAGTGLVLSPTGEILTNNHVIKGATSITVTVESTGRSYSATVVGTAPTKDVAVLRLQNASGLQTANLASRTNDVQVGDSVVGVGNAGGTGTLTAVTGKVTALDQSITASDETGQDSERLTRLIQVDAPIISGDSGGPLYDAAGEIIGMNTAASANRTAQRAAFAIRIDNAVSIAAQIESGVETTSIHIGYPGFLGISTQAGNGGVGIASVLATGPAAKAGITAGSTITAIDGLRVRTPQGLRGVLTLKDPGSKVSVSWTGADGTSRTATVTLATGPAD